MEQKNLFISMKETIQHGFIYGFGQVLSKSIGFLLIPLYTRCLPPSDYGILALLTITSLVAVSLFQLGLNSALFRSYYDYEDEENRTQVISTCFYVLLVSSSILAIGGYFLSSQLSRLIFETTKYEKYLCLIIFTASLNILRSLPFMVYRAKKLSKRFTFFNVTLFILQLILIIYFVAFAKKGVWGVILANFIGSLITVVTLMITISRHIRPVFSTLELRKMLSFGLPLVPVNLSGLVLISAGSYFLKFFSTVREVGLYNLGYKFGLVADILLVFPLAMVWTPMLLSIKDEDYSDKYYSKALTYYLFVGIIIILGLSILSRDTIRIMADKSYWAAYKVVPLIAISFLLLGVQRIINVGITLKRKTQFSTGIFIFAAVLNLILNFFLIPRYGMMGAAFATVISYLSIVVIKYPIVMRLYRVEYEWKRIIKMLCCGIAIYLVGSNIEVGNVWTNISLKIIVICTFPFLLFSIGFYEKMEKKKIAKIWKIYAPVIAVPNNWRLGR